MVAIGIDIGGTSIKGSLVNDQGKVGEVFNIPIIKGQSQETTINRLITATEEYINKLPNKNDIEGIGLGIPGSIDSKAGVVTYSNNLEWEDLHIVEMFKKRFDYPIKITNDANAAALGEATFGAGRVYKDVIMITLGTGVGSGIIIDGKIYDGLHGKGAEIGHSSLLIDGVPCNCGRRGCVEAYCSSTALQRQIKEGMEKDKSSIMWELAKKYDKISSRIVFEAEQLGDKAAIEVLDKYIMYLGETMLNICNIFRPDCIVLSGGIANQGENLTSRLIRYCEKYEYGFPRSEATIIKIAELGYNSGIIGAACQILNGK